MAECPRCGKDVSIWGRDLVSGVCNDCIKAEVREAKRQEAAKQTAMTQAARDHAAAEAAKLEQRVCDRVVKLKQSMLRRLEAGLQVIVYHSIYLPVDSVLLDEPLSRQFDTAGLFQMGLQGWEAIQVVPRTVGVGLENTSLGSALGAGHGRGPAAAVATWRACMCFFRRSSELVVSISKQTTNWHGSSARIYESSDRLCT